MREASIVLYRKPNCPSGDKAKRLLEKQGLDFHEHVFKGKDEEQAFKREHEVQTTPQIQWDGRWIGGFEALSAELGEEVQAEEDDTSYVPVIAVFATAAALSFATRDGWMGFMGYALAILACLKLMDIESFVDGFRKYDLLTPVVPFYGKLYPFLELLIALGITGAVAPVLTGSASILVGLIGSASVIKAVYIDKRDLNCACIGGNSKAPLGAVSLSENLMMLFMGGYLLFASLLITW